VTINIRTKGATAERELAALLTGWAANGGHRLTLERNLDQVRGGGFDLNGVPFLAIEVKRQENLAVNTWWAQCVRQADAAGFIPFLAYRQNNKPWRFRVRTTVAHYSPNSHPTPKSGVQLLDIDLDVTQAKEWFLLHLEYYL
jgi:Holliday junction resolvase